MIYINVEGHDECGEGVRAQLYAFSTREEADRFWAQTLADDVANNITDMKMFVGTELKHFQLGPEADRTLSNSDLQTSTLEDVDNLSDKENV